MGYHRITLWRYIAMCDRCRREIPQHWDDPPVNIPQAVEDAVRRGWHHSKNSQDDIANLTCPECWSDINGD